MCVYVYGCGCVLLDLITHTHTHTSNLVTFHLSFSAPVIMLIHIPNENPFVTDCASLISLFIISLNIAFLLLVFLWFRFSLNIFTSSY